MNNKKYFVFDLDETLYKLNNDFQIILTVKKDLLKILSNYGDLIVFSNATYSHCLYWLQILDILELFKGVYASDIIKEMKPNPLSYKKIIELAGIKKHDCVYFFDDMPINLFSAYNEYKWITFLINKKNNMNNSPDFSSNNKNKNWLYKKTENINQAIEFIIKQI